MVGYNVQAAVDTKHHQIVAHEVTSVGTEMALHVLAYSLKRVTNIMGITPLTEAKTGFRAFNEGTRETGRALAKGTPWTEELVESLMPKGPEGKDG